MQIQAADLARLCYNGVQFSAKDSSLGGTVMFYPTTSQLFVCASDDYVAMEDSAPARTFSAPSMGGDHFYLGLKELKELEKFLRDKDGSAQTQFPGDGKALEVMSRNDDATDLVSVLLPLPEDPPDFQPVMDILNLPPNPFQHIGIPFAIRAARFTKFRLLRTPPSPSTKDEYPVDFHWDGDLLRWKCGPFLRGVVAPLQRESFVAQNGEDITGIEELFEQEREAVLW